MALPAEHDIDSPLCWCLPRVVRLCVVCGGKRCAACEGEGWSDVPGDEIDGGDFPMLVIHNDFA